MTVCSCPRLKKGEIVNVCTVRAEASGNSIVCAPELLHKLAVGSLLCLDDGQALLKINAKTWQVGADGVSRLSAMAEALSSLEIGVPNRSGASNAKEHVDIHLRLENPGYSLAWVTLSDKGARGEREDKSGPLIEELIKQSLPLRQVQGYIIPDEEPLLRALLTELALVQRYDLILTTGGTGVSPRDVTPEAMQKVLERELPGFSTAMLLASLSKTSNAIISRAKAGILGRCLIINLPGSPKAVAENLAAVLPTLEHTLEKINGDPTDCGR